MYCRSFSGRSPLWTMLCLSVLGSSSFGQATPTQSTTIAPAPRLKATVSWIGNTFSGHDFWVPMTITDLFVAPDGSIFTNTFWEEGGENVVKIAGGKVAQVARHTHGWGYEGGNAITANDKYVFIAQEVNNEGGGLKGSSWPEKGMAWTGVSRRDRSDISHGLPFAGGVGKEGDVVQGSFLPVVTFPEKEPTPIEGLAASDRELFVSVPGKETIYTYDCETMKPGAAWSGLRVTRLSFQHPYLYGIGLPEKPGMPYTIERINPDGEGTHSSSFASFELPAGIQPTDIAATPDGHIWITDDGPSMRAHCFVILGGATGKLREIATVGEPRGAFAPPAGKVGRWRFNAPHGIGIDRNDNIYIAHGGTAGNVLEAYSHIRRPFLLLNGLTFVDMADQDPAAPHDIFTKQHRFSFLPDGATGKDTAHIAYTLDPARYPEDPRLHLDSTYALVRRIQRRRILFVSEMVGGTLQVYRFTGKDDIAIPCGLIANRANGGEYPPHQPKSGAFRWEDKNGDGRFEDGEFETVAERNGVLWPDSQGNVWQADGLKIRRIPFVGFAANGTPQWSLARATESDVPKSEFDEARRVRYLPASDTLLIGGNQGENRNQHWKPMGPVLARYDGWSRGAKSLKWRVVLPLEKGSAGHESKEPISFDVAGDYIFVAYTRGLPQDGIQNAFVKVLRLSDGKVVGNLSSDPELGEIGLLDLVESVRAVKLAYGEYLVFLEDDMKAKVILFRWRP